MRPRLNFANYLLQYVFERLIVSIQNLDNSTALIVTIKGCTQDVLRSLQTET
jgi:hypothetical protein